MFNDDTKRILIVEDDKNTMAVIKEALDDYGYLTAVSHTGAEALGAINIFKPHLVLTDHNMPDMTGLEMLKKLRSKENYVTVIFVSARADGEFVSQTLRLGADDFVRKPFMLDELIARIEVSLRNNELHRELFVANVKLQEMIEKDYLTGLYNMRSMYDRIDFEIKRARRFKRAISCIMIDMDHFKRVNDDHDHLFGSFVLKEMGQIIIDNLREIDFGARYGGDEFLVVLTETDEKGTQVVSERLREKIQNYVFENGKDKIQLTVSLGYSILDPMDNLADARSLVKDADRALYESKRHGRNRVTKYTA
ncbi:MAG: diguanylate cyclase [Bdellovibrionaceae bacterium]|nr:diguanylate cyclase [Pseudobdellovibrionaceae bacterium]